MKKILALFMILTTYIFSQGWNDMVTTSISETNMFKMDLFTNKDGNHVITQNTNSSNSIKYYLLNSAGTTVIRSATIETEGSAQFPNISGDNNKVYLVYKLGTYLKAKESTDAGASWSTISIAPLSIGSNICNGVDIVYDYQGLHVVYATKDSDPDYETHYYKLSSTNAWVDYKNVTDGSEVGGFPTVSVSANRVHVAYNTGHDLPVQINSGRAKSRDKVGTTWATALPIYFNTYTTSATERIHAGSTKLFNFYYKKESSGVSLCVKAKTFDATTWPGDETAIVLQTGSDAADIVSATTTSDGKTHIVYSGTANNEVYRSYDGSSWSSEYSFGYPTDTEIPIISSAGNDLFITLRNQYNNGIQYRQYDAIPSVPQNYQISSPMNSNPVLSWNANPEPDAGYRVYKKYTGPNGTVLYNGSVFTTSTSYTDGEFTANYKTGVDIAEYWVKAEDINNNVSGETAHLNLTGISFYQQKIAYENDKEIPDIFKIDQNFPNPFNPSTIISYSLPQAGLVNLKIFDLLGNEVAELINEVKEKGYYRVQFNGENLSSGVYIYAIRFKNFIESKRMILMK